MALRLGINPLTWTNDDMPELGGETPLEVCLAEAREAGYEGIEMGRKFPRRAADLGPILARHGLALVSGWYSAELLTRSVADEIAAVADLERPILFDLDQDPLEMHDLVVERPDDPSVKETLHRMQGMLEQVCSPGVVDAQAKSDQRDLRASLEKSGRLKEELWKRGYERRTDRLMPRSEMIL